MNKEEKLVKLLNVMLDNAVCVEGELNHHLFDEGTIDEEATPEIVLNGYGEFTVFSLISTITETLVGKRLTWVVDDVTGIVKSVMLIKV